jgi:hypothetical protein
MGGRARPFSVGAPGAVAVDLRAGAVRLARGATFRGADLRGAALVGIDPVSHIYFGRMWNPYWRPPDDHMTGITPAGGHASLLGPAPRLGHERGALPTRLGSAP